MSERTHPSFHPFGGCYPVITRYIMR